VENRDMNTGQHDHDFETLTDGQFLRRAVLKTLEGRPNNSSKVDDLPKHVLRHVGKVLRGRQHRRFETRVRQVTGGLKRAGAVEQYSTARNSRVRLTHTYLVSRGPRRSAAKLPSEGTRLPSEESVSAHGDVDLAAPASPPSSPLSTQQLRNAEIPDLPDILEPEPEEAHPGSEPAPVGDDTAYLLSVLTEDQDEVSASTKLGPRPPAPAGAVDTDAYFEAMLAALNRTKGVQAERTYSEIRIELSTVAEIFPANLTVKYVRPRRTFVAESGFPLVEGAALDLLRLCGTSEFSSTIGAKELKGAPSFVVRRLIGIHSATPEYIAEIALQFVDDTRQVAELLGRYR
jgi:hypothetical protein